MKRAVAHFFTLAALATGLYGISGQPGNAQAQSCAASKPLIATLAQLTRGEVAAVQTPEQPKELPGLAFTGPDGKALTLADFRGKTILLNLWATWCAPCRREMPALDKLQATLGGEDFEVVAINIDQRNLDKPKAFLQDIGVQKLAYYSDPTVKIFQSLKAVDRAFGMPTTLLIDKNGCELGYLPGPAEWASEDALKLVRAALGR
jgi:thiol-disulfide isomerase/thioredoxin